MFKCLLLLGLTLSPSFYALAQGDLPCGTAPEKSAWLQHYQTHKHEYPDSRNNNTIYLPLKVNIVGTDNGAGRCPYGNILDAICKINEDFANSDAGMYFFLGEDFNLIDNTYYYDHDDFGPGYDMMLDYYTSNNINVFTVADPAGAAGYNIGTLGMAVNNGYMNGTGVTFAHEMGHNLSLPHTFFGWEGTTYNYSTPTLQQYPGGGVPEKADSSNCQSAADGFCDTPADYLSYRWSCNNVTYQSFALQQDQDGQDFLSDGRYIMSYSLDNCRADTASGFSQEQVDAMRTHVYDQRQDLLSNQNPFRAPITDPVVFTAPADSSVVDNDGNVTFSWNAVPNATHYIIQFCWLPSCNIVYENMVTTDTFYNLTYPLYPRPAGAPFYKFRVRPFNQGYTCTDYSEVMFNATAGVGIQQPSLGDFLLLSPNLLQAGATELNLTTANSLTDASLTIFNTSGQLLHNIPVSQRIAEGESTRLSLPAGLPTGLYFLRLKAEQGVHTFRFVVAE